MTAFDPHALRRQFPALTAIHGERPLHFFDSPGGTQVPERVIDAVSRYYRRANANSGGAFATSRETDQTVTQARAEMADLLNAAEADTILFGPNMTTLTFHLARSLGDTIHRGDEIIVTDLDHDANVTPWTDLAAQGAAIRCVPIRHEDCTLDIDALGRALTPRTRLVAVTYASNAVGSLVDVRRVTRMAQAAGAMVFVDAVQYAPHGPVDVQEIGCDFLACSAYKFFGPHVGILYGRRERLQELRPHKVAPAPDSLPYRWETGTQNHEGLAGVSAAVQYLHAIGEAYGAPYLAAHGARGHSGRRLVLKAGMQAILEYEQTLSRRFLERFAELDGARLYGISDPRRLEERLPTFAFTWPLKSPAQTAAWLAAQNIAVWSGNYYALRLMEALDLQSSGGAVRVGLCHYNTLDEVDALFDALHAC